MPPGVAQRLRQQLQQQAAQPRSDATAAAEPGAAGCGSLGGASGAPGDTLVAPAPAAALPLKRKTMIREVAADELNVRQEALGQVADQERGIVQDASGDHRQQQMEQLQSLLQHTGSLPLPQRGSVRAPGSSAGGAAAQLAAQQLAAGQQGSSGQLALLGMGQQLPLGQALGGTPSSQGSMTGLLGTGAMLGLGGGAGVPGLGHGAPLLMPAAAGGGPAAAPGGQPPPMLVEPLAKEEMFLLSQAYGSMTAEQKEKLAAQPPEVRQYVLQERMRKTREQLALLHQHRAAAVGGLMGAPVAPPQEGLGWPSGDAALGQPGMQVEHGPEWLHGAGQAASPLLMPMAGGDPRLQMLQQHAQFGGSPAPPLMDMAQADAVAQARMPTLPMSSLGFPGPHGLQAQQRPPQMVHQQQLFGQPGGALGGAPAGAIGAPFVAMSEAGRLEHLRNLMRRQDEWIEQQRLAASHLGGPGGAV